MPRYIQNAKNVERAIGLCNKLRKGATRIESRLQRIVDAVSDPDVSYSKQDAAADIVTIDFEGIETGLTALNALVDNPDEEVD